jgi:hypothetical protein
LRLGPEECDKVANVWKEENGTFMVEFFDVRDAHSILERLVSGGDSAGGCQKVHATAAAAACADAVAGPLNYEEKAGSSASRAVGYNVARAVGRDRVEYDAFAPVAAMPNAAKLPVAERRPTAAAAAAAAAVPHLPVQPAPGQWCLPTDQVPAQQVVRVSGLANALLTEKMFEAVLQQASLLHFVLGFDLHPGEPCGEATLKLRSSEHAHWCVKHFRGCQWAMSGEKVNACLEPAGKKACSSPKHVGWRLKLNSSATEASTDAGLSEADDEPDGEEA